MDLLKDAKAEGEEPPWMKNKRRKSQSKQERKEDRKAAFETAYDSSSMDNFPTVKEMAEYMGISEITVRNRAKEFDYRVKNGLVFKSAKKEN